MLAVGVMSSLQLCELLLKTAIGLKQLLEQGRGIGIALGVDLAGVDEDEAAPQARGDA